MNSLEAWVVPNKINVELVLEMPNDCLKQVVELASNIVVMHINRFIQMNGGSNDEAKRSAAAKLADAAAYVNMKSEYLSSEETKDMVEELRGLSYEDININVDKNTLLKYRMLIEELLTNDFAVAYTEEKDTKHLEDSIRSLKDQADKYGASGDTISCAAIWRMCGIIDNNRGLFRNPPFKRNSSTILRSILYRKEDYELIKDGIDFLLERMNSGSHPRSWRRL